MLQRYIFTKTALGVYKFISCWVWERERATFYLESQSKTGIPPNQVFFHENGEHSLAKRTMEKIGPKIVNIYIIHESSAV